MDTVHRCVICTEPLTKEQYYRRVTTCSKSCARKLDWQNRKDNSHCPGCRCFEEVKVTFK